MTSGPSSTEERVLLVSMPFGAIERPALSLSLLQAHCDRLGVACDTLYLTFEFARRVGLGDYLWLCSDDVPYTAFAGEWLFAAAIYGARPYSDAGYVDEVLRRTWQQSDATVARLNRMRAHVEPFIDHCLRAVPWSHYTLVGFTSVFQQNLASLALAARVKREHPQLTLCFGGANWEEIMGVTLQAQFPFVDLVFSGEADESFPAVLRARREGRGVQGIRGVTAIATNGIARTSAAGRVPTMEDVPTPNFAAFFEQFRVSPAAGAIEPTLLIETSRGCWWGERAHCTFCGLNGATMAFRSKKPDRVMEEIAALRAKHGVRTFNVVDDILDMSYFNTVLPSLARAKLGIDFFWEIKSNLSHQQIRQLRDAGVTSVQPGIESLSDHVLKLMRKGVSAFRNIELMKWCREFGVKPFWNMLYGFPGETREDYAAVEALIPAIWHLDPPTGYGPIRIDRFSPYHNEPGTFGLTQLRPMAPFTYLYPFDAKSLQDIAYYFEFDYADGRDDDEFAKSVIEMTRAWMADGFRGTLTVAAAGAGHLEIMDTRGQAGTEARRARLSGWKAAVFLACDRAQTFTALSSLREITAHAVDVDTLLDFLGRCVANRMMVSNGKSWLNTAVHCPARNAAPETALAIDMPADSSPATADGLV